MRQMTSILVVLLDRTRVRRDTSILHVLASEKYRTDARAVFSCSGSFVELRGRQRRKHITDARAFLGNQRGDLPWFSARTHANGYADDAQDPDSHADPGVRPGAREPSAACH